MKKLEGIYPLFVISQLFFSLNPLHQTRLLIPLC